MKNSLQVLALCFALGSNAIAQKPLTTNNGAPVGDNQNSLTIGKDGPVLLQDIHLIEKLAAFDRERIPERVVHARGAGAYGEFECKADMSSYTKAKLFNQIGKKTPVFVRFSTVIHGNGSPETLRDPRGFATKFYTEEGNYDIVGNNLPVFFIRDAIKFPDMVHSLKPSPITNKQDPNRFFDFFSHIPEATHMLMRVYSDYGIPASYSEMNGSSVHAFKWINIKGEIHYVKYTWKTRQGERNMTKEEASKTQAEDFQHATVDLYKRIREGKYPQWDLFVQILNPKDFSKLNYNPLDATKIWNESDAKSVLVGTMTLNKIPENFFEHTEQSAFSPGNLIPGIETSEDKLLQGRLFSYFDTQRHRIGSNFQQLPVNAPHVPVNSNNQDGFLSNRSKSGEVNYQPSRIDNKPDDNKFKPSQAFYENAVITQDKISKPNDFLQAGEFYRSLDDKMRINLLRNLSDDLKVVTNKEILLVMTSYFFLADKDFGLKLANELKIDKKELENKIKQLQN